MIVNNLLGRYEQNNEWQEAIHLLNKQISGKEYDLDVYVRVTFLLLNHLIHGSYTKEEHDYIWDTIKYFYNNLDEVYNDDAEYLFFMGFMIPMSEWYFGVDDVNTAFVMIEKAIKMEQNNILYRWLYLFYNNDKEDAKQVAIKIIASEAIMEWLIGKGMIGRYIKGTIEHSVVP